MKIILKSDIRELGKRGEIVNVAPGYARNYLIPKGYAILATDSNIRIINEENLGVTRKEQKRKKEAETQAKDLNKISLTIAVKTGEDEKLYGSVTVADISKLLEEQGIELDKKKIMLEEPIKSLGVYIIPINLHSEVECKIKLWVVKE